MSRRDLSEALTAVLAPAGFHRRGTRWYRTLGATTDVVALVTSKSAETVSVELGVFDPVSYRRLWPTPKTITEADCIVRVDLGRLAGSSHLWDTDSAGDISEIVALVQRYGLEWLDNLQTREDRVAYLRQPLGGRLLPMEIIHLAHAEADLGDLDDARHRLQALRDRTEGPFLDFLDGIIARLETRPYRRSDTDSLVFLQEWLLDHSDGEWEHDEGVTIESLDNPGWLLRVALTGTDLEGAVLDKRELNGESASWVHAWADGTTFDAAAGPLGLGAAIEEFRRFVLRHPNATDG